MFTSVTVRMPESATYSALPGKDLASDHAHCQNLDIEMEDIWGLAIAHMTQGLLQTDTHSTSPKSNQQDLR